MALASEYGPMMLQILQNFNNQNGASVLVLSLLRLAGDTKPD